MFPCMLPVCNTFSYWAPFEPDKVVFLFTNLHLTTSVSLSAVWSDVCFKTCAELEHQPVMVVSWGAYRSLCTRVWSGMYYPWLLEWLWHKCSLKIPNCCYMCSKHRLELVLSLLLLLVVVNKICNFLVVRTCPVLLWHFNLILKATVNP